MVLFTNNLDLSGAEAGQTVPHSHFHIIPRQVGSSEDAADMTDAERKNLVLGEGPRAKLDGAEGERLSKLIKVEVAKEVSRLSTDGIISSGASSGDIWANMAQTGLKL
jgi:hypothetical protein